MQLGVSEILDNVEKIKDETQKIIYLRQQGIKPVQMVLQYALDPNIEWLLPTGLPEFKPNEVNEGAETILLAEARRMYLFVKGGNDNLEQRKREILFVQFLEMLCPADVELIKHVKDKTLPYPSITYDLVKKAFPNLLPDLDSQTYISEAIDTQEIDLKTNSPIVTEDFGKTVTPDEIIGKEQAEKIIKKTKVTKPKKTASETIKDAEKKKPTTKKGAKKVVSK